MPTFTQISNIILRGRVYQANLVKANITQVNAGNNLNDWTLPVYLSNLIQGLQFRFSIADYTSTTTVNIYNKLGQALGLKYINSSYVDPSAQIPGISVVSTYTSVTYTKTQANLIDAGGGNWYLPYLDNAGNYITGYVPQLVTSNGVSFQFTYDASFSPPRIYGFANNLTQTILITAI
jgi:hypothetical protein